MKRTTNEPSLKSTSTRSLFRGRSFNLPTSSGGESSKAASAVKNGVHGLPDFESPLAGRPSTGQEQEGVIGAASISITSSKKDKQSPRQPQRMPSARLEERRATTDQRTAHASVASPHTKTGQKLQSKDDYEQEGNKSFENMIIECDHDTSDDELTYDGSIMHDEGYWRNQYHQQQQLQQRQNPRGRQESNHPHQPRMVSPQRNTPPLTALKQTGEKALSRARNKGIRSSSGSNSSNNINCQCLQLDSINRPLSIDEEEELLIELAMERSLQDSYSGSMSVSDSLMSSASGRGSYRSRTSSGGGMSSSSNLGSAGCHLAMLSSHGSGQHYKHPSQEVSNCVTANNFIWKRDGKKWQKIPVHGHHDHHHHHAGPSSGSGDLGLHAIKEVENENLNDSHHQSQHKRHDVNTEHDELDYFDFHQQNVEEAMHRSLTAQLNRSAGNWSLAENSFADEEESDRKAMLARRLQELEQEKAIIELAMHKDNQPRASPGRVGSSRRLLDSSQLRENRASQSRDSRATLERRAAFQARPRTVSNNSLDMTLSSRGSAVLSSSGTESLSAAGCHLAMIASRYGDNSSCAGSSCNSKQQKLVWKRGPNNAWGRFPEFDDDCEEDTESRIREREEALVAEALMRSLSEM